MKQTKKNSDRIETEIKKMKSEYEALRADLTTMKAEAKSITESKANLTKIVKANEKLNNEIEVIQSESMRDNLLFHGIKELPGENCTAIVQTISRSVILTSNPLFVLEKLSMLKMITPLTRNQTMKPPCVRF